MTIKNARIYKLLVVIVFIILLVILASGQTPQRSEEQRLFDDFVTTLVKANGSTEDSKPQARLEFIIGGKEYKSELNWQDRGATARVMRILELLKSSNVFSIGQTVSEQSPGINQNSVIIKVIGPSGYEFKSSLPLDQIKTNSPLALALVLIKETW